MKAKFLGGFDSWYFKKDKIYNVISVEEGWLRILIENEEDYLFPPEAFEIIDEDLEANSAEHQYKINRVSIPDHWIFLDSTEESSLNDSAPFVTLIKYIASKLNNGNWKEKIKSVGDMRFTIANDPLKLVYQWDDLYGIVIEYSNNSDLENIKSFLYQHYSIA